MAKMFVGPDNVVPAVNAAANHWGDIFGDINKQKDLQNALDSRFPIIPIPNALYGTDNNSHPTAYDTSSLFSTESVPVGYTEVEYITSTLTKIDPYVETISTDTFTVSSNNTQHPFQSLFSEIDSRPEFTEMTINHVKFTGTEWYGYVCWAIVVINEEGEEFTFYDAPQSSSSLQNYWGIIVSGTYQVDDYFIISRNTLGGQYINTGVVINNYPNGYGEIDRTKTELQDPDLVVDVSKTYYATTLSFCNTLTARYGSLIRCFKLVADTDAHLQLYAVYTNGSSPSDYWTVYSDAATLQSATGVYISDFTKILTNDIIYVNVEDSKSELVTIETALKANQDFVDAAVVSGSYGKLPFLGSMERSNNAGIEVAAVYGDGKQYKHYDIHTTSLTVPYRGGIWNSIKVDSSSLIVNGDVYPLSINSSTIRCANPYTPITLFAVNYDTNDVEAGACSMKTTRIYKNEVPVFIGIPCIEDATGKAGMYDIVSQRFLSSEVEGAEFVASKEVTTRKISFGVDEPNVVLGLGYDKTVKPFYGANGVIINSVYDTNDYEELEYLESTDGNCAIDTGLKFYKPSGETSSTLYKGFEVTYALGKTSAGLNSGNANYCQYIIGDCAFSDSGQSYHRMTAGFFDGRSRFNYSSTSNYCNYVYDYVMEDINIFHTLFISQTSIYLDGKSVASLNPQQYYVTHNQNIHLFNVKNVYNGTPQWFGGFIGKISRLKQYQTNQWGTLSRYNVLLADLIPVRRKSDGELGFYDTINGRFCPNINSNGTLVAGPTKQSTISLQYDITTAMKNIAIYPGSSYIVADETTDVGGGQIVATGIQKDIKESTIFGRTASTLNKPRGVTIFGSSVVRADYGTSIGTDAHSGLQSVAIGYSAGSEEDTTNGWTNCVTIGSLSWAKTESVAVGFRARATGYSVAVGYGSRVNGSYGIKIGNGNANSSEGLQSNSVSIGYNTSYDQYNQSGVVIGYSAGLGFDNGASTLTGSVIIGNSAKGYGSNDVAIGNGAIAKGEDSIAIGPNTVVNTNGHCAVAIGVRNINHPTASCGVSIGSYTWARGGNAVAIGYDNEAAYNSIAIGSTPKALQSHAIAMGDNAQITNASNDASIAIGWNSNTSGNNSIAIGKAATTGSCSDSVAIGNTSVVSGGWGVAIGINTDASESAVALGRAAHATSIAIAIGKNAIANGRESVQLGTGTNSNSYSLQFRNYPLVDSDGIIPYDRLSLDAPTNGYVLSYDEDNDCLTWVENGEGGGSYELPIASATTLGGIKVGTGLSINSETGVLSVTGGTGGGDGVWGQITGDIDDQIDLKNILDSKFEQTLEMPKASNEYNGNVLQFIGITDLLYKHGYVYECQYKKVSSLTGYTSDDSRFTVTFDARRFEEYFKEYHPEIDLTNERNYSILFDGAVNKWNFFIDGTTPGIGFDTYNLQHVGIYLNYLGQNEPETDDEVTMEYIPSTDQESPFGYEWHQLSVQPQSNVVDNVASSSTTDALSANQGRILSDRIDNLSSIGTFLAIWDCDTGTARYLNDGYQYTTGNYFIVGTEGTEADPTRSGTWSSEILNPGNGFVVGLDDITKWEETYSKLDRTLTFTCVVGGGVLVSYWRNSFDNSRISTSDLSNLLGINITAIVHGDTIALDSQFTVTYKKPTICYIPTGSEYDTETGHTTTTDDIQISDMFFYDGSNWILLANHGKQTAVDHDLDPTSKNPVENATVTNALNNKVSTTSNSNRVYGTTALGEQIALEIGNGFINENGVLSVDISGKQDTLVSGENIKTINGESILGSGDIEIQGGGGEGMGTLNISNVFHRYHSVVKEEDVRDDRDDNYKGGYQEILFTTNADIDYLKANKEDIYVTYSRRNAFHNLRKYRILNDHRVKSDVKLYCWRYKTYQYWDSTFNTMRYDEGNWDNYKSDLNYEYFYTLSDYSDDVEAMYDDNPTMFISDLRRQGAQKDDDNYSMGNWGTCLNELYNYDTVQNYYDDYSEAIENGRLERCAKYDIDELVIDTQDLKYDEKEDTDFIIKMVGQSFTKNGLKYYFWSHEWWNEGSIYACLDDNDDPIPNYVPEDKSKIVYFCEFADLESEGYELVEKRPDLVWWKFDENRTTNNISRFIKHCREITTNCSNNSQSFDNWTNDESVTDFSCNDQWSFMERIDNKDGDYTLTYNANEGGWYFNYDGNLYYPTDLGDNMFELLDGEFSYRVNTDAGYSSVEDGAVLNIYFENRYDKGHRVYLWDYPIQPVRLSQCKILMTSMPPFQPMDPETGEYPTDKYEDYMFHAYTFDEIAASEDLTYMLQCQKEIIFVYPYDTHHLWMRTFGFTKMVYQHARVDVQQYQWHWEDDNPTWDYDPETSEKIPVDYTMYAEPWDRHNLRRGMFLGGQRNLGNTSMAEDTRNLGDFDNRMGPIQGTYNEPRWSMGLQALYFLPVALNINKANEVFYNTDGKSTPFYFKLCITGMGNQKILAGQ